MNKVVSALMGCLMLAVLNNASAADTKEDCVKLVKSAGDYLAANGKDKLISEINNTKGTFANGETYLFASDYIPNWDSSKDRTVTLAHGANPKLVGKDMTDLKDADGVYFVKKMAEIAASKSGEGWTSYKWPNPVTKQLEQKSTYTKRVSNVVISCGVYN